MLLQRRNRPNLAVGDLVYARVAVASRDMEPELACTDAAGKVIFLLLAKLCKCTHTLQLLLMNSDPQGFLLFTAQYQRINS